MSVYIHKIKHKLWESYTFNPPIKYSYFKYIGMQSEEINSKEMYKPLINQIREKCLITNEEEREINEFITKRS